MAEQQRENSVLFSLRELRKMEDDRIRQEQDEATAKANAERAAREEAERRTREEAERRRHEEEERLRRNEEAKVSREREEQMRLQEAERRARVEGEMRLQEERMRLEVHARKAGSPMGAILGVAVVLVLIGGGVIYKLYSDNQAALAAAQVEKIRVEQEQARRQAEANRVFEARIAAMQHQLDVAKTDEEKARLRADIARESARRVAPSRPAPRQEAASPAAPKAPKVQEKRKINDDPLEGIKL